MPKKILQSSLLSLLLIVKTLTESQGSKKPQCITQTKEFIPDFDSTHARTRRETPTRFITSFSEWKEKTPHLVPVYRQRAMAVIAGMYNYAAAFIIVRAQNRPKR